MRLDAQFARCRCAGVERGVEGSFELVERFEACAGGGGGKGGLM